MGELHLEILVDRMKREFGVEANVGAPQVAYREPIKKSVEQEGKFVKQSGGRGQYGHVWIKLEPNEAGKGFEFVDAIKGGTVPREFIPAVEKGYRDTCRTACWPASRWWTSRSPCSTVPTTTWTRTKTPSRWRLPWPSRTACARPARAARADDGVEVETPRISWATSWATCRVVAAWCRAWKTRSGGIKLIKAEVPLAEMFGYSTTLRSLSQGRATYSMEFKHYSEAPKNVAEAIINKKSTFVL
jgi:elongation factor G